MDRDKRGDPDRRNPDDAKLRQDAQHQQVRVTGRQHDLELVVAEADQQVSGSDQALDRLMKQVSMGVRTPSEKLSTANAGSIEPW
jgi:hypothetical protein